MNSKNRITDIVVSFNDFLLEADKVGGGLYICQNGGMGLLAKSANKPVIYVMQKFFEYIQGVPSKGTYDHVYYYDDLIIPPILIDHLLDNDTDENILKKVKIHINKNAKWMDKKGILAIADMTFHHEISSNYRVTNQVNIEIVKNLSKHFTIHLLGNCSKISADKMAKDGKFVDINGHVVTSSELGSIKCSRSGKYDIYEKFLSKCGINPINCLFIETHPGHIKAIKEYGKSRHIHIKTMLYDKEKQSDFATELSEIVGIIGIIPIELQGTISETISETIQEDVVGEFVTNDPSGPPNNTNNTDSITKRKLDTTITGGSASSSTVYEQLNDTDGNTYCTIMTMDGSVNVSTP